MADRRLAAFVLLAIAAFWRGPLEARMALHMLVHVPLLIVAGAMLMHGRQQSPLRDAFDATAGLVLAGGIVTTWMIPRALDLAVENVMVDGIKAASLVLAGAVGTWGWGRASAMVRLFALGNVAWMTATTGLLYLDAPVRICTSYARNDQQQTGIALLVFTVLAGAVGLWRLSDRSVPTSSASSLRSTPTS